VLVTLDVRTLTVLFVLVNLTLGISLLVAFRGRFHDGIGKWILSLFFQSAGYLLILERGSVPAFFSIPVANTLVAVTYALAYVSLCEFYAIRYWRTAAYGTAVALFVVLTVFIQNYPVRVAACGLVFGIQHAAIVALLLRTRRSSPMRTTPLLVAAYGAATVLFFSRVVAAIVAPRDFVTYFAASTTQSVTLTIASLLIIVVSLGVLSLHNERIYREKEQLAAIDPLTGLRNRLAVQEILNREIPRGRRYEHPIGVMMLDVNRFKEVNDRFGHLMGDKVLQGVAEVLRESVRESDVVARWGGDEFLVLLLETGDTAHVVKERINTRMADRNLRNPLLDFPVTLAVGTVDWSPESGVDMEAILAEADKLMYEDKRRSSGTA
jgi:diguanylate cyclase (GGDEF)-like protein